MIETLRASRFLRFLFTGGIAALANFLSRIALSRIMNFELAVAVAYLCGMTVAFLLAKLMVFEASGRSVRSEYIRFGLVNVVALAQVWVISVVLAHAVLPRIGFAWHAEAVAHLIGLAVPVVTSYLGHKHFSFAPKT